MEEFQACNSFQVVLVLNLNFHMLNQYEYCELLSCYCCTGCAIVATSEILVQLYVLYALGSHYPQSIKGAAIILESACHFFLHILSIRIQVIINNI